jgi:crotonobetainyl-CoA:carnitine CoA-transferase CaiB-like acyl-CoA transferase
VFAQSADNQRSLAPDLRHTRSPEIIQRLVAQVDVVIVNHPRSGVRTLGLGYAALKTIWRNFT